MFHRASKKESAISILDKKKWGNLFANLFVFKCPLNTVKMNKSRFPSKDIKTNAFLHKFDILNAKKTNTTFFPGRKKSRVRNFAMP
jgi:hypothetical protein